MAADPVGFHQNHPEAHFPVRRPAVRYFGTGRLPDPHYFLPGFHHPENLHFPGPLILDLPHLAPGIDPVIPHSVPGSVLAAALVVLAVPVVPFAHLTVVLVVPDFLHFDQIAADLHFAAFVVFTI